MQIDTSRLWKADTPGYVVVLDAECRYDHVVHRRYLQAERFVPADVATLSPRDRRTDPRVTPRWACQQIVVLSWAIFADTEDGLRPLRMETRGAPELDEAGIVRAFFADMNALQNVELVTWGGFHNDVPQILLAAAAAGLRLPSCLSRLHSPWRRHSSGHRDLMTEMCAGASSPHLAEVAAKFGIPAKVTCRPDLVSQLMDQGKWSSVKSVCEGDVLTTSMILMHWRHLLGGSTSTLEATRRLCDFVTAHCGHRSYAAHWQRFGERILQDAFTAENAKLAIMDAGRSACLPADQAYFQRGTDQGG